MKSRTREEFDKNMNDPTKELVGYHPGPIEIPNTKYKCKKHGLMDVYGLELRVDHKSIYICLKCLRNFLVQNIGVLEEVNE